MSLSLKTASLSSLLAVALLAQTAQATDPAVVKVHFQNHTNEVAQVHYYYNGNKELAGTVNPGRRVSHDTWLNIYWEVSSPSNSTGSVVTEADQTIELGTKTPALPPYISTVTHLPLNRAVLRYAKAQVGNRVGSGQSRDLVVNALRTANANAPAFGSNFGQKLAGPRSIQPGDVIQMTNVDFGTGLVSSHTAIVLIVRGDIIKVLEQNAVGSPVQNGVYNLSQLRSGTLDFYRPTAASQNTNPSNIQRGNGDVNVQLNQDGVTIGNDTIQFSFDF